MIQPRKITLLAVGSTGDLYPFCALALGLQQVGHQVKMATTANFETFVRGLGFEFAAIAGDYQALLRSETGQKLLQGEMVKLIEDDLLTQQMNDALNAAQDAEVLMFNQLATWGYHVAERLDIPSFLTATIPLSATRQFPFLRVSADPNGNFLTGWLNYGSYLLTEFLVSWNSQSVVNRVRKSWGLSPLPALGPRFRRDKPRYLSPLPILYGISPSLVPRPPDWDSSIDITGAWFLDRVDAYEPPATLTQFLDAGDTPICIGFGSMVDANADALTNMVVDAIATSRQRAVLLSGWGGLGHRELADSLKEQVFVAESVPHSWLFPRVKAVVHHGGSGTTAAVCRAGLPSVVVPYFADQIGWAERLHQLGVSPEPILRKELTAESLAAAIEQATHDSAMQQKAAQLGEKIRAEDGVEMAVSIIHRWLGAV